MSPVVTKVAIMFELFANDDAGPDNQEIGTSKCVASSVWFPVIAYITKLTLFASSVNFT